MTTKHIFPVSLAALLLSLATSCASDRQVIAQASSAHDELAPAVVTDAEMKSYIKSMGDRIVDAAQVMHGQKYGPKAHFKEDAEWMFTDQVQFHFVNSKTINAFTTGGEHMYMYTELLQSCRNEDELAAVMAHEYGHIYGRHVQKGMNRQYYSIGGALLGGVGGYALGGKEHGAEYAGIGAGLGLVGTQFLNLGFTRSDEAEADELGFDFYARAGWDPQRFGGFFQTLIDKGLDQESDTMSDHPTLKSRVAAANKRAAKLGAEGAQWRKPPVADAARFAAMKQRAEMVGRTMPNDQSLEKAQTLLAAVASCVSPTDMPDQVAAREKIVQAAHEEERRQAQPKR